MEPESTPMASQAVSDLEQALAGCFQNAPTVTINPVPLQSAPLATQSTNNSSAFESGNLTQCLTPVTAPFDIDATASSQQLLFQTTPPKSGEQECGGFVVQLSNQRQQQQEVKVAPQQLKVIQNASCDTNGSPHLQMADSVIVPANISSNGQVLLQLQLQPSGLAASNQVAQFSNGVDNSKQVVQLSNSVLGQTISNQLIELPNVQSTSNNKLFHLLNVTNDQRGSNQLVQLSNGLVLVPVNQQGIISFQSKSDPKPASKIQNQNSLLLLQESLKGCQIITSSGSSPRDLSFTTVPVILPHDNSNQHEHQHDTWQQQQQQLQQQQSLSLSQAQQQQLQELLQKQQQIETKLNNSRNDSGRQPNSYENEL